MVGLVGLMNGVGVEIIRTKLADLSGSYLILLRKNKETNLMIPTEKYYLPPDPLLVNRLVFLAKMSFSSSPQKNAKISYKFEIDCC